jgi:hypothetical protein
MTCSIEQRVKNTFVEKEIIDDMYVVDNLKLDEFEKLNKRFTDYAENFYKLDTNGKNLYESVMERFNLKGDAFNVKNGKRIRAVPNLELFNELDKIVEEHEAVDSIHLENIASRKVDPVQVKTMFEDDKFFYHEQDNDYGRTVKLDVTNYISNVKDSVFFERLEREFYAKTARKFVYPDVTAQQRESNEMFLSFLQKKGLRGLEYKDSKGDVDYIFLKSEVYPEYSDTALDKNTEPTIGEVSMPNRLADYSETERDLIYKAYSPEQVNQMLEYDAENAYKLFDKIAFGEDVKNSNFVSDKEVNDQIRKCK